MKPKTLLQTLTLLMFILLGAAPSARAAGPELAWQVVAPSGTKDHATKVAADAQGNIYVTGDSLFGDWRAGATGLPSGDGPAFVAKFSPAGQRLWSVGFGIGAYGKDIVVDPAGNVYVTGYCGAGDWAAGGYDESYGGNSDGFIIKLSPEGRHLWSSYIGGAGSDQGYAVSLDKNGDVLLTGKTSYPDWIQYDYRSLMIPGGYESLVYAAYVVKLTPQGERLWSAALDGGELEIGGAIASDSAGNVCVAGVKAVAVMPGDWSYPQIESSQPFLAKLTPEGRPLWKVYLEGVTYRESAVFESKPCGLAVDAADNLYLGAIVPREWQSDGTIYGQDGRVTKLNPDGKPLWSAWLNRKCIGELSDLAMGHDGDIYAAGVSLDDEYSNANFLGHNYPKAFVIRLTPAGRRLWSFDFGDPEGQGEWNMYSSASLAVCGGGEVAVYGTAGYRGGYLAKIKNCDQAPTGALSVSIAPAAAVVAGAQWRLAGEQAWRASGDLVTSVTAGLQEIELKSGAYWVAPRSVMGRVTAGQTAQTSVTCTVGGALTVTLEPAQAVAEGARWRRAGAQDWLESGATDPAVTTGSCAIEFKPLANWAEPTSQTLVISAGQTASAVARYAIPPAEISWADYLGGQGYDYATAIAIDAQGYLFVTGATDSPGWCSPADGGTGASTAPRGMDGFVARLSPQGALLWSLYFGDAYAEAAERIALDSAGNALVTSVYLTAFKPYLVYPNSFLHKISPEGRMLWSVEVGSSRTTAVNGLAVDGADRIHLAGYTTSAAWLTSATRTGPGGLRDGFIASYSPAGGLLGGAIMGGSQDDSVASIAVDRQGNLCVAGKTASPESWSSGGYDVAAHGYADAFAAKFSPVGQHLWSARLGGSSDDAANDIAIDAANNLCVVGSTLSNAWTSGGYDTRFSGYSDGFAVKLTPAGQHLWSTYLGGYSGSTPVSPNVADEDAALAVAVNGAGDWFIAGQTQIQGWIEGSLDDTLGGDEDGFLVKLTPNGQHAWSSYIGGEAGSRLAPERCYDVALSSDGGIFIAGAIASGDWVPGRDGLVFHPTPDAHSRVLDGFVAAIREARPDAPRGAVAVALSPAQAVAAGAQWRRVGETTWRDSLTTGTNFPAGPAVIEFKPTQGWHTPASRRVTIADGQTTAIAATYVRQIGALRVDLAPAQAVAAGAQWRRVGQTAWRDSGTTETGIEAGYQAIEFKTVAGWNAPDNALAVIAADKTTTMTGVYQVPTAQLRVTLTPYNAATVGARWRLAGESAWRNSGETVSGITSSSVQVVFQPLAGWDSPTTQTIPLTMSRTNLVTGAYVCKSGSLSVTLFPAEAVAAGAKWRRVGTAAWQDSGAAESAIPPSNAQIEFAPLDDWDSPSTQTLPVVIGQTSVTSATYQRAYGSLCVTITPPEAVLSGAKWRRKGTTEWRDSGTTEPGVPCGNYTIEFVYPTDYYRPEPAIIHVGKGSNAYALPLSLVKGSLTVTLSPADLPGAKWRRVGSTEWLPSGATVSLPIGFHQIECADVTNWRKPALLNVTILKNTLIQRSLSYTRVTGSLCVTITPPEAAQAGAAWRRVGTTQWWGSDMTEAVVATGAYEIEFRLKSGWTTPAKQSVTVVGDKLTTASAAYVRNYGSLCVTITPPEAVAAGAMWRRVGSTEWRSSGATETNVPTGFVAIEFKPVRNWTEPKSMNVVVSINLAAQAAASYIRSLNAIPSDLWTLY